MPFGMVNGVGRGIGVLGQGGDRRRGRAVLGVNLGRPIITNKDIRCIVVRELCALPKLFRGGLVRPCCPALLSCIDVHVCIVNCFIKRRVAH